MAYTDAQIDALITSWIEGDEQASAQLHYHLVTQGKGGSYRGNVYYYERTRIYDRVKALVVAGEKVTKKNLLEHIALCPEASIQTLKDHSATDPHIQCHLGIVSEGRNHGTGTLPLDYGQAILYFEQAIAQNNILAMICRADMYRYGRGGPVNQVAALCLYLEAYTRANAALRLQIRAVLLELATPTNLEKALPHYPISELCIDALDLSEEAERTLLTGVDANERITALTPVDAFVYAAPAVQAIYLGTKDTMNSRTMLTCSTYERYNWHRHEFDQLFTGWMEGDKTTSARLYFLVQEGKVTNEQIEACKAQSSTVSSSSVNTPLTLFKAIVETRASVKETAPQKIIRYLEGLIGDGNTYAMCHRASLYLRNCETEKARELYSEAASRGNLYASYTLATMDSGREPGQQHRRLLTQLQLLADPPFPEAVSKLESYTYINQYFPAALKQFTGKTLVMPLRGNYIQVDTGLCLPAILGNIAITTIPDDLLSYFSKSQQETIHAHLRHNDDVRSNYETQKQQIRRSQQWGTTPPTLLKLAFHYGDHVFIDEALCHLPPDRILTLAQHGVDAPNESRRMGLENDAEQFGMLDYLRQRVNEETLFCQILNYLDQKSRERGAEDRYQERCDNYASIIKYLSLNCEDEGFIHRFSGYVDFLTSQAKVSVGSSSSFWKRAASLVGVATTNDTYNRLRDLLKEIPPQRLVARYKEQEHYLLDNPSLLLVQELTKRIDTGSFIKKKAMPPLYHYTAPPAESSSSAMPAYSAGGGGMRVDTSTPPYLSQQPPMQFWSQQPPAAYDANATTTTFTSAIYPIVGGQQGDGDGASERERRSPSPSRHSTDDQS